MKMENTMSSMNSPYLDAEVRYRQGQVSQDFRRIRRTRSSLRRGWRVPTTRAAKAGSDA